MGRFRRLGGAIGLALIAAGCKSKNTTEPNPTIQVTLSKSTLSIQQGGNDNLVATVTGAGGFSAGATVTVEGVPAGVTGAVSNVSTSGSTTTATVTINVALTTTPGAYNLTVRASGSGVTAVTAGLSLTVTPTPAVAITVAPTTLTLDQGGSGPATVTIARTNFTGNVDLALDGAPTGVTAVFAPAPATGNTATATIQVGNAVAAGTYNMTIRATGTGISPATTPLGLTVTIPVAYSLQATATTAAAGASGQSAVTITRTNFTAEVALTLEGAPNGVTSAFNPTPTAGTTSTLTLDVANTVAAGDYPLTVRGVAAGLTDRTASLTLTVTPVQGAFTIAINPGSVGVSQGGGSAVLVTINRTGGFTGPVDLTVTGMPNGLTATPAPASPTGNASLALVATAGLATGTYPLVVKGTASGLPDKTANVDAVVNVANVALDFAGCGTGAPIWLAIQDGPTGPWVETLAPNGIYRARPSQSKVALAFVTTGFGNNRSVQVQYMSAAELQASRGDVVCGNPTLPTRTANATTVNLTTFQIAFVAFGGAQRVFSSPLPGGALSGIAAGMHDLISHSASQNGGFTAADRLIIRRDLNPANGGSLGAALDYTSGEAVAPIAAVVTLTGMLPGEVLNSGGTQYLTEASCQSAPLWSTFVGAATTAFNIYGVPAASQRPTDFHAISASTSIPGSLFRQVTEYSHSLVDRTIALPAAMPAPTIVDHAAPYRRLEFQFTVPAEAAGIATASYGFGLNNTVFLTATAGWLGGTSVALGLPDFASSADWDDAWGPPVTANPVSWTTSGFGSSGSGCGTGRQVGLNRSGNF